MSTDKPDAPVTDLDQHRGGLDLDAAAGEELPPFEFKLDGQWWTVPYPGAGAQLDAEHALQVSDLFEIIMGEDLWGRFEPVLRKQTDGQIIWKLAVGLVRHFKMDAQSVESTVDRADGLSRAQRRAGRRVRRG